MTPLPKRRHSSRRQGKRRAAIKYVLPRLIECNNCHQPKIPHQQCPSCGVYRTPSKAKTPIQEETSGVVR